MKRGRIINGVYTKGEGLEATTPQSTYKQAEHQRQRDRHSKDLLQPFTNFKPNKEFIRAFPEESKKYFSEKEIKQYGG